MPNTISDVLAQYDVDGDGNLSADEQARLVNALRGTAIVQQHSDDDAEAAEVSQSGPATTTSICRRLAHRRPPDVSAPRSRPAVPRPR